jgi:hypothetical protein
VKTKKDMIKSLIRYRYSILLGLILANYVTTVRNYWKINARINEVVKVMDGNDSLEAAAIRELIETTNKQIDLDKTILVKFQQLYHKDTVNFNNFRDLKSEVCKSNSSFRYRVVNKCVHND